MPVNGHTSSSQTLFSPRQNGQSHGNRIPVTASSPPSAVRPVGLGVPHGIATGVSSVPDAVSREGERSAARRWQDKAVLTDGPPASPQPGPDTNGARSSVSATGSARSQNDSDATERLVKGGIWMKPGVKSTMQRLAEQDGLSFSAACANALEVFARAKIHDQEETLFEPRMQAMLRREIHASDNRHIYFEMRNALAAEQTRILTTDLYKRQLRKEGVSMQKINQKLDDAYEMAKKNILRKTKSPQLRNLLAEWWRSTEEQDSPRHDQPESRGAGHTDAGEAGTGNTHA